MTEQLSYYSQNSRYFPSSLPVRSPSPDTKNSNKINKTVSPVLQIKKQQITPSISRHKYGADEIEYLKQENQQLRSRLKNSQRIKMSDTFGTDHSGIREKTNQKQKFISNFKFETDKNNLTPSNNININVNNLWRQNQQLKNRLVQKDKIIVQLKKVLANMSESDKHRSMDMSYSGNQNQLRQKLKVLSIENEKLGQMVRKLNLKKHDKDLLQKSILQSKSLESRIQQLKLQNNNLREDLENYKYTNQQLMSKLNTFNNSVNINNSKLKNLQAVQQKLKVVQKQNQKLIKLLKEQRQSKNFYDNDEENVTTLQKLQKLENQNKILKDKMHPQKLTISKIKQQYQQNLKIFQERVYEQVQQQFQKMYKFIQQLQEKINQIAQRKYQKKTISETIVPKDESPIISKFHLTNKKQKSHFLSQGKSEQRLTEDIKAKYNQLINQYNLIRQQNKNLIYQLTQYQKRLNRLSTQNQSLIQQKNQQKTQYQKKYLTQINKIKQQSNIQINRIKMKSDSEVQQIKKDIQEQITRISDTYNQQIVILRSNIQQKNKQIQAIKTQIIRQNTINNQRLQQKQYVIQKVTQQLNTLKKEISEFNNFKKQLLEEQNIRKRSYTQLQLKFAELNNNIKDLKIQKTKLLQVIQQLQQANLNLKNTVQNNKNQIKQLEQTLNHNNMVFQQRNSKFQQEILLLKNKIENLKKQNRQNEQRFNNRIIVQKKFINRIIEQIQKINGSLSNVNLQETVKAISLRFCGYEQQRTNLMNKWTKSIQQQENFKKKFLQTSQKLFQTQKQIKFLNAKIEFLTKSNDIKEDQCLKLKNMIDSYLKTDNASDNPILSLENNQIQLHQLQLFKVQYKRALQKLNIFMRQIKNARNTRSYQI